MKKSDCKIWTYSPNLTGENCHQKNDILEEKRIVNEFNNFFLYIGPDLADDIPTVTRFFESYEQKSNKAIKDEPITITFFYLKIIESDGYNEISFNIPKVALVNLAIHWVIYLAYHSKKIFSLTKWKLQK